MFKRFSAETNGDLLQSDFTAGTKVKLKGEFGIVLKNKEDNDLCGLIRWDTEKDRDIEDWRGQWRTFITMGGNTIETDYIFKYIEDDGLRKIT